MKQQAVRAAIFDLDGTLVDTGPDITASVNATRAAFGRPPIPMAEAMRHIGDGVDVLMRRAICASDGEVPRARELYRAHHAGHFLDGSVLYPGVAEGLRRLAAAGIAMSVVTNKAHRFAAPLLEKLGVGSLFTHVLGEETQPARKPAPDGLLLVLGEQGVAPADALMVGDSWQDLAAGRAAGCRTVWCRYGFGNPEGRVADFTASGFPDVVRAAEGLL
jgi:phosphoglycolate phosphatase